MTMRYAEYAPDPRLAMLVRCYWVFEATQGSGDVAGDADETIVPDGNPELVFHYGESFSEIAADARGEARPIRQPQSLFAGQLTRPLTLRANGSRGVVSVRFEPWGARAFWDMPMSETTDRWVALDDMPGRWLDGVSDRIREANSDRARIGAIESDRDIGCPPERFCEEAALNVLSRRPRRNPPDVGRRERKEVELRPDRGLSSFLPKPTWTTRRPPVPRLPFPRSTWMTSTAPRT